MKKGMDSEKDAGKYPFNFGWLIILVGFLVTAIRAGIGMQTLGFIVRPMQQDMGWQSSVITLCITLQLAVAAVIGPKVGRLLDSVGAKKILTAGLIANGVMLILISTVQEVWQLAVVMVLFGGVTQACIGSTMIMPFITKWFRKRRGSAMGFVSAGANLGSILIAPLIVSLMGDDADWRHAWFVIGLIPIVLVAPIVYVILDRGEGRKPTDTPTAIPSTADSNTLAAFPTSAPVAFPVIAPAAFSAPAPAAITTLTAAHASAPAGRTEEPPERSFTVKEALRTPVFWKLMIAWNLVDFSMKGALLNKIPYALEMNYTTADGAGILAVYGLLAIVGKVVTGLASDKIPLHVIGVVLAAFQTVGMYMFVDAPDVATLYLAYGILSGLSAGGLIALMPIMLAKYYGGRFQGALSGITISLLLFSSVGGPVSASIIRDVTGSYENGFLLYALLTLMAVALFVFIRKPKPIII